MGNNRELVLGNGSAKMQQTRGRAKQTSFGGERRTPGLKLHRLAEMTALARGGGTAERTEARAEPRAFFLGIPSYFDVISWIRMPRATQARALGQSEPRRCRY